MTQEEKDIAELDELLNGFPEIHIELPVEVIVSVIATIQLAHRHPMARFSRTVKEAVRFARTLQDGMDSVRPGIGRLIEKGWHEVFDERNG